MTEKIIALQKRLKSGGLELDNSLLEGRFGAVLAHAGIGKTALMVQLALLSMFQGKNVLHISLEDSLKKVDLWYQELFHNLAAKDLSETGELWENILSHRFIMIFKVDGFTVPKLEERLTELVVQKIFVPHTLIIDGLHFDEDIRPLLIDLDKLAEKLSFRVWFTVHTHRYEVPLPSGMNPRFAQVADLFAAAWQLEQEKDKITVTPIMGSKARSEKLHFDPATMLVNGLVG